MARGSQARAWLQLTFGVQCPADVSSPADSYRIAGWRPRVASPQSLRPSRSPHGECERRAATRAARDATTSHERAGRDRCHGAGRSTRTAGRGRSEGLAATAARSPGRLAAPTTPVSTVPVHRRRQLQRQSRIRSCGRDCEVLAAAPGTAHWLVLGDLAELGADGARTITASCREARARGTASNAC